VRLSPAIFVIERAYGKPVQPTERPPNPLEDATTDVLLEMQRTLELRMANYAQEKRLETKYVAAPVVG